MVKWSVGSRGTEAVEVEASNWVVALGLALEKMDRLHTIERLACEILPNGKVIALDVSEGSRWVIAQADRPESTPISLVPKGASFDEEIVSEAASESISPTEEVPDTENDICTYALDRARETCDASSGSVILDQGDHLAFVVSFGPNSEKLLGMKLPPRAGVAGYALEKKRAVVLGNAADDPRHFGVIDQVLGARTRELACVPIVHNSEALGVIEMMNLPQGERFTREQVQALQGIAAELGLRLSRASAR